MAQNGSAAPTRSVPALVAAWAAWLATAAASLYLLVAPISGGHVIQSDSDGVLREGYLPATTLLASRGPRAYLLMLVPLLFASLVLVAELVPTPRALRWTGAVLLSVFVIIGMMSVGLLYLPAAALAVAASLLTRRRRAAT